MIEINAQSRRRFIKNMAKVGAILPFAGSMLGENAFAATGYKNVLFIYHPNGSHAKYWHPSFTGPINTSEELSFGLGALKQHHKNMIVFKNIHIDTEPDGGMGGAAHSDYLWGCLTGDKHSDSVPSVDHLIAEKLGSQGVLSLGVRTGNTLSEGKPLVVSKPRGVDNFSRPIPNNNPFDVATKLSARLMPEPEGTLKRKIYEANLADIKSLPKAQLLEARRGKITQHEDALTQLKNRRMEGSATVPFNFNVKETVSLNESVMAMPNSVALIEQFPALCKAQIDNAVAAFANKLHRVATLQLSVSDDNGGRVNYSFEECWDMAVLAHDRKVGDYLAERGADRKNPAHNNNHAYHSTSSCSFQAQVRWHFSLVGYALEKLKSAGILDETLVVTVTDMGDADHEPSRGGIVVAGGAGGGLPMGQVIDCGSVPGGGTHKLYGDIARLLTGANLAEGPWKGGII
ncbi:MAG TPA: DUF1552 domain-containing protein [Cellvibrio sp.]|nr:DUF1552 domain-containing protein [Cellvibrio sp.]